MSMEDLYGREFEPVIKTGVQQMQEKFRDKTTVETVKRGEAATFGYLDSASAREKTVRHEEAVRDNPDENRITVYPHMLYKEMGIDSFDRLKTLADLNSPTTQTVLSAIRRAIDDIVIAAAFGSKWTGKNGTTESVWDTSYQIAANATYTVAIDQIISALELLNTSNVDENEEKFIMVSPKVLSEALMISKLTSSDYQTLQALVPGKITQPVLGFRWGVSTRLPVDSQVRSCMAWAKSGIGLKFWEDIKTIVDIDKKKVGTEWWCRAEVTVGATRIENPKVIKILCDESKVLAAQ